MTSFAAAASARFLCVDDELPAIRGYVDGIQRAAPNVTIEAVQPERLEAMVERIRHWLRSDGGRPPGLIFDWRLSDVAGPGSVLDYRFAATVVQTLRTEASTIGSNIPDVPVVLWSTQATLDPSYRRDDTPHDLFDWTFDKDDLLTRPEETGAILAALASGYWQLRDELAASASALPGSRFGGLLGLPAEQQHWLDRRCEAAIGRLIGEAVGPAHVYARFILRELIRRPGPLIDTVLLAAILGIDRGESSDWPRLLADHLAPAAYRGVFANLGPRWWSPGIGEWWESAIARLDPLLLLPASERVTRIAQATGLSGLITARPIDTDSSDRFTTICVVLQRPLDAAEGFRINEREPEPWQQPRYLSPRAVRERIGYDRHRLRVHPSERPRVEAMFARLEAIPGDSTGAEPTV